MNRMIIRCGSFSVFYLLYISISFLIYLNTSSGVIAVLEMFILGILYLVNIIYFVRKIYLRKKVSFNWILFSSALFLQAFTYLFNIKSSNVLFDIGSLGSPPECLPIHFISEIFIKDPCTSYFNPLLFWIPLILYFWFLMIFLLGLKPVD
jgi:hypothetical protein